MNEGFVIKDLSEDLFFTGDIPYVYDRSLVEDIEEAHIYESEELALKWVKELHLLENNFGSRYFTIIKIFF